MSIQCSDCSEPLLFAVSVTGKKIPFDRTPNERGRFLLIQERGTLRAIHDAGASDAERTKHGPDRYICHWDTCPTPRRIR